MRPPEVHAADEERFPVFVALCDDSISDEKITYMRDQVTCPKCKGLRAKKVAKRRKPRS